MSFNPRLLTLLAWGWVLIAAAPSHGAPQDSLETLWAANPSLPGATRQGLTALIQQAQREGLPTDLLMQRLREGLAKRADPTLLAHRLEALLGQLRGGRALLQALSLKEPAVNDAGCLQGVATLLDWGVSSDTIRQLRASWDQPPACRAFLRGAEWNFVAEKEGIPWPSRSELLRQGIAAASVDRLPYLWMRGRTLGLGGRQVLRILTRDLRARTPEPQIMADFERVAEILGDVEHVGEPLLPGSREEERIRQRLDTPQR